MKADAAAIQQANLIIAKAAARGTDAGRALSELGLLHTDRIRRQIMVDTLLQTAEVLDETSLRTLGGASVKVTSPADAKRVIVGWLQVQAQLVAP